MQKSAAVTTEQAPWGCVPFSTACSVPTTSGRTQMLHYWLCWGQIASRPLPPVLRPSPLYILSSLPLVMELKQEKIKHKTDGREKKAWGMWFLAWTVILSSALWSHLFFLWSYQPRFGCCLSMSSILVSPVEMGSFHGILRKAFLGTQIWEHKVLWYDLLRLKQMAASRFPVSPIYVHPTVEKAQSCFHEAQIKDQCPEIMCHWFSPSKLNPLQPLSPSS